jgi:hypothetical protein
MEIGGGLVGRSDPQGHRVGWAGMSTTRPTHGSTSARWRAFIELHIEHGPRMEVDSIDLAVVTGMVGVRRQILNMKATVVCSNPTSALRMAQEANFTLLLKRTGAVDLLRSFLERPLVVSSTLSPRGVR